LPPASVSPFFLPFKSPQGCQTLLFPQTGKGKHQLSANMADQTKNAFSKIHHSSVSFLVNPTFFSSPFDSLNKTKNKRLSYSQDEPDK
jgi:hypothetical protein